MSSPKSKAPNAAQLAPPMGPILHWRVGVSDQNPSKEEAIEWENTVKMAKYIIERVDKLMKSKTAKLSKLELEDLRAFAKWAVDEYEDPLMDELSSVLPKIDTLLQSKRLVDDDMKKKAYIGGIVIEKGRFENRDTLLRVYNSTINTRKLLLSAAQNKTLYPNSPLDDSDFKLQLKDKEYVQYLIDHNIFRKSDIKKAFPTDIFKEFERFKEAYYIMKAARKK